MIVIRQSQIESLNGLMFDRYVDSLVDRLGSPEFSEAIMKRTERPVSQGQLREFALSLIARARTLGFSTEADVTPFVLLLVLANRQFRDLPVYTWINAALHAEGCSGSERMDAVFALLPLRERLLCFGNLDRSLV